MKFYTLPARKKTLRGTSVFRLGPAVPDLGVNLAFVQSIAMDIQENLQSANLGHLIPENNLWDHVDLIERQFGVHRFYAPAKADGTIEDDSGERWKKNEQMTGSHNIAASDTCIVDGVATRWDIDSPSEAVVARYKVFSIWWHVESGPAIDSVALIEHASQNYTNSTNTTEEWFLYQGNRVAILNQDGTQYEGAHAIYIRQYSSGSARLRNVWKVMAYIESDTDVTIRYDKGEIRGSGITDITGYKQEHDEKALLISVIPESVSSLSRTWFVSVIGTHPIFGDDIGPRIRVFFEDHAKIDVVIPTTASNHLAWFTNIKKGRFARDETVSSMAGESLSTEARIKLDFLKAKYEQLYGGQPPDDATVRVYYSTDEYSRNRQGRAASQMLSHAPGVSCSVDEDMIILPYEAYPGMPIIIVITETLGDPENDRTWAITNMNKDWGTLLDEIRQGTRVGWYSGSRTPPPTASLKGADILSIVSVEGNRVVFDNTLLGDGRVYKKWFTTLAEARGFFYHRNQYVPFTGYRDGLVFHSADFNPSLGHSFSGQVHKELKYDDVDGVWESGVHGIDLNDIRLYDITEQSFTGATAGQPREIPLADWNPVNHPKTDLSIGEFQINNYLWHKRVMMVCSARKIPGYNLFTTPVNIRMKPYKMSIHYVDGGVVKDVQADMYGTSEKIVFNTRLSGGNLSATDWDTIPLSTVQVVPNTIYGQNVVFDTRSRGGGLKDDVVPVGGENHFWDVGYMDGKPYTGNQAIILEIPASVRDQFREKDMTDDQIETMFRNKLKKYVAKGSLVVIQYV